MITRSYFQKSFSWALFFAIFLLGAGWNNCTPDKASAEQSTFYFRVFPSIVGPIEFTESDQADLCFYRKDFAKAIDEYTRILKFQSLHLSPLQKLSLHLKKAWTYCLMKEYELATVEIQAAQLNLESVQELENNLQLSRCIDLLKARVAFEGGKLKQSALILKNIFEDSGDRNAFYSYLSCLWMQKQSRLFVDEISRYKPIGQFTGLRIANVLCKCSPTEDSIYGGLFCRNRVEDSLVSWKGNLQDKLGSMDKPVKFSKNNWISASGKQFKDRVLLVPSLLKDISLYGQSRHQIRDLIGPPAFCIDAKIYEDRFPLAFQPGQRFSPHSFTSVKFNQAASLYDSLWFLVVNYDENGNAARIDFLRVSPIALRNNKALIK